MSYSPCWFSSTPIWCCQETPVWRLFILYMSKYYFFMDQILSHILLPLKKFFFMWISIIIIVLNYTRTLNKFVLYIKLCLHTMVQKCCEMSKNNFFIALESEVVEYHFLKLSQNIDFWEKSRVTNETFKSLQMMKTRGLSLGLFDILNYKNHCHLIL